jgi:hypothetical protein
VTSRRQRAANRANSAKSTGPRSQAGKAASQLNARRHGLATAVQSEPGADAEIERLASAIVDEAGRPDPIEFARRVAEAEIDLRRIQRARVTRAKLPDLINLSFKFVPSPNRKLFMKEVRRETRHKKISMERLNIRLRRMGWRPDAPQHVEAPIKPSGIRNTDPKILDRYERRAFSRRKSAIRRFDELRFGQGPQSASGAASRA